MKKTCDLIIVGGLSMGAVLALKLAQDHPDDVQGITLYAPTIKLDGWSVPWYAGLFSIVYSKRVADLFTFKEREPYGLKNPRFREFVSQALFSEDSSQAGLAGTPGRCMLQLRYLTKVVKENLGRITQPTLILHPREDDRASIGNAEMLARKLGGRVTTIALEDCYHVITLDQQRDVVLEETKEFGKTLERRRAVATNEANQAVRRIAE